MGVHMFLYNYGPVTVLVFVSPTDFLDKCAPSVYQSCIGAGRGGEGDVCEGGGGGGGGALTRSVDT